MTAYKGHSMLDLHGHVTHPNDLLLLGAHKKCMRCENSEVYLAVQHGKNGSYKNIFAS